MRLPGPVERLEAVLARLPALASFNLFTHIATEDARRAAQESEAENMAALQLAKEVREKIAAGADFVEMVKQYSKDPVSRDKNGDYGPLKITDEIPALAKQAIWGMNVGDVSQPVKLPNGYYLFKLIALEEPGIEKVREELAKRLRSAKSREWLNAMRSQVQVQLVERKPESAR